MFLILTHSLLSLFFFLPSHSIRTTPQFSTEIVSENWSNYTISELKNHFHRFGYLALPKGNTTSPNFADEFDEKFKSAILRYQSNLGLPITGELDSKTLSQIATPRCGLADITNAYLTLHGNITTRRRYVYFPGKPRWARKIPMKLTYAFSPDHTAGNHLSPSDVRRTFRLAFSRWSSVIPVSFSETENYGYADIRIGFYGGDHGDSEPFDGPLGVLAHSFSPEAGRLHLDAAERWAVDGFRREDSAAAIDLESVATHEIGHVLGLGHSSAIEAVMYPSLKPRETKLVLKIDDIEGVQALYGSNPKFSTSSLLESDVSSSSSSSSSVSNNGVVAVVVFGFGNSEILMMFFAVLVLIEVWFFNFL